MNLSIPLGGIQTAEAAFDSAAQSIQRAFNGPASNQGQDDSVDLSSAVAGLLSAKLAFLANEQVELVENSATKSALSVLA